MTSRKTIKNWEFIAIKEQGNWGSTQKALFPLSILSFIFLKIYAIFSIQKQFNP